MTILLFSGGLDSSTLLYKLIDEGHDVECLAFNYGQKHRRELLAAKEIAATLGVSLHVVQLPHIWENLEVSGSDVIPNRNMVFLSIAAAYAINRGADSVAWGPNRDDWGVYPDCREDFAESMRDALSLCHNYPIGLMTPFISVTKTEVVKLAHSLEVPIGATWSCYEGGRKPCRKCSACVTRAKAIQEVKSNNQVK